MNSSAPTTRNSASAPAAAGQLHSSVHVDAELASWRTWTSGAAGVAAWRWPAAALEVLGLRRRMPGATRSRHRPAPPKCRVDAILEGRVSNEFTHAGPVSTLRRGRCHAESTGPEVVVCIRHAESLVCLPKGTPEPGESEVETALREVQEETGLQVEPGERIGSNDYWFVRNGATIRRSSAGGP
ncbi:MAG: NUDIX domain-containing protein [Dehalococcoidia bacterium]|nr:NUDIX domain-containing protein [Dehalococcoidia bacterium]